MATEDTCNNTRHLGYTCKLCQNSSRLHTSNPRMYNPKLSISTLWTVALLFTFVLPLCAGKEDIVYVLPLQQGSHAFVDNVRHVLGDTNRRRRSLSKGTLGGTPGQGYYIRMGVGTPQQMVRTVLTFWCLVDFNGRQ